MKHAIRSAGEVLERQNPESIGMTCMILKRDFKGLISNANVKHCCAEINQKWLGSYTSSKRTLKAISKPEPPLTPQEQEYVQASEDEYRRNKLLDELIELWTGKNHADQGRIIGKTPKGSNWRKLLVEESRDHMLKLAKQMTDTYVSGTLYDMRTISYVAEGFGDILYEEQELRKEKEKVSGI